jgi:hypothetical protein
MAVRVHHVLFRKDAVGDHEILDNGVKAAHAMMNPIEGRLCARIRCRGSERTRVWWGFNRINGKRCGEWGRSVTATNNLGSVPRCPEDCGGTGGPEKRITRYRGTRPGQRATGAGAVREGNRGGGGPEGANNELPEDPNEGNKWREGLRIIA